MKNQIVRIVWQTAISMVVAIALTAGAALADERVVEPGQQLFNKSYNELASEWTNWLVLEPIATNPAFDPDGRFCARNQKGKVWFLATTFGGVVDRTCKVPAGTAIFVSLGGAFIGFPDFLGTDPLCSAAALTDLEEIRCDVNNDVPLAPSISFVAVLDGVPLKDLFAFRAQSEPGGFTLRAPDPSLLTDLGFPAGDRTPAVADGYFLFLKPLRPGKHTLTVIMTNPDGSRAGVNYTLMVPGQP